MKSENKNSGEYIMPEKNNDIYKEYERNHAYFVLCSAFEIISIFLIVYRGVLHRNVNPVFFIGVIKVDVPGIILFAGLLFLLLIYGIKELVYKKRGKIPYLLTNKKLEENILMVFCLLIIIPMMIAVYMAAYERWF